MKTTLEMAVEFDTITFAGLANWETRATGCRRHLAAMIAAWKERELYIERLEALNDKLLGVNNDPI